MASDHRTMRSGPGPTFTCSNQRLWRMIPSRRSSQAFQHGLVPLQYPSFYRSLLPPASLGEPEGSRVRLRPYNTTNFRLHDYLCGAKFPEWSRCERPSCTTASYPCRGRNPYISKEGVSFDHLDTS